MQKSQVNEQNILSPISRDSLPEVPCDSSVQQREDQANRQDACAEPGSCAQESDGAMGERASRHATHSPNPGAIRRSSKSENIIQFPVDAVFVSGKQLRTTSIKVSEAFGKLHKNVIQKLESLDCSDEFASANFSADETLIDIGNGAKRTSKIYEMTKDGFMFLVMGFTGKKAAQVKEAYIKTFNLMAERIFATKSSNLKTKTALPNGLTLDQCDAIKALVKARAESCPKEKQGAAAIKCWSSIKSKFGCSYKEIAPEHFTEALSLVARIELEGEYLPAGTPELPPIDVAAVFKDCYNNGRKVNIPANIQKLMAQKSVALAIEAHDYLNEHLAMVVADSPSSMEDAINGVTLGKALAYKRHTELSWIASQAANMRAMALDLEARIRSECVTRPLISA